MASKKSIARKNRRNASRSIKSATERKCSFENLEVRQLMSTVNVASFGAVVNDGKDDTAAIRAAINASGSGDTIQFNEGTYNLSDTINLKSNRTYLGNGKAKLMSPGGTKYTTYSNDAVNITVNGLILENRGLKLEKSGGVGSNVTIVNCTFQNMTAKGVDPHALYIQSASNYRIENNTFQNIVGDNGILAFNVEQFKVQYNKFDNCYEGIHVINFNDWAQGVSVSYNTFTRIARMGIEMQEDGTHETGGYDGLRIEGNHYSNPINLQRETFAYSIVPDAAINTIIRNNYASGPASYPGLVYGFELASASLTVENNRVDGGWVQMVLQHTKNATLRNNQLWGGKTAIQYNRQTNSNVYSNDIRGAVPNVAAPTPAVAAANGGVTTPVVVAPTQTAPAVPSGLASLVKGASSLTLKWNDAASNETGFKLERSNDGKTWTQFATVGANITSYDVTGLETGKSYSFRVRSYNATSASGYSTIATATPVGGYTAKEGVALSSLTWKSATNAWGTVEKNLANGETAPSDGGLISLGGKKYATGLGTNAGSEVVYQLDGKYARFRSDIGIDDEVGSLGSAVFQVWADGVKVYDSGVMTGASATKKVDINLTGVKTLKLVTTDSGDGKEYDHASWADARVIQSIALPVTPTTPTTDDDETPSTSNPTVGDAPSTGDVVYLSDLNWTRSHNGWGAAEKDKSNGEDADADGGTITLNGQTYTKGLGVHANAVQTYAIGGQYSRFIADIGLDDSVGSNGSAVFQVWGNGRKLYDSGVVTGATETRSINIDVTGISHLKLVVQSGTGSIDFDHANWAAARLVKTGLQSIPTAGYSLSDLNYRVKRAAGGIERDQSAGGLDINDGSTMKIGNAEYEKGLGVRSGSDVRFDLGGRFSTFTSEIGLDSTSNGLGKVSFQVYADGVKVYDSGTMTSSDSAKQISVNVAGKRQLWLVVTDTDNSRTHDFANWADARLAA